MIGWTKRRKRCPEHGLVLRKENKYSREANYCPACGKQLTVVSVPYLFQVYFHPAIMIVPGILLFFVGLFIFFDVQGCIIEGRRVDAIVAAEQEAMRNDLVKNLPEDWQIVYPAIHEAWGNSFNMSAYSILRDFLGRLEEGKKMSRLTADEIRMFIQLMPPGNGDDAFELITIHMGETR